MAQRYPVVLHANKTEYNWFSDGRLRLWRPRTHWSYKLFPLFPWKTVISLQVNVNIDGIKAGITCYLLSIFPEGGTNSSKSEAIRLENQHRLCYTLLNRNLFLGGLEISSTARILDVGTSSGIWAIEMAEKYPDSTVIGLDISPQQLVPGIPSNCSFVVLPV
jgi:Putative methyltransferase